MDMNNTPERWMPLVANLEFLDLMGVISSPCTTRSASTRATATGRRGRCTKRKAGGYVDDRLRRPAPLPPLPEQARKAGKCSPSPTYPPAPQQTKEIDINENLRRGAACRPKRSASNHLTLRPHTSLPLA